VDPCIFFPYPPSCLLSGKDLHLEAFLFLQKTAIDAACRLVNTMKTAKAALTSDEFIARATREIERLLKRGKSKRRA
jgi:hypothetical protein